MGNEGGMKHVTAYYAFHRWPTEEVPVLINKLMVIAPLDMEFRWDISQVFRYQKHVLTSLLLLPPLRCDLCGADLKNGELIVGKRTHASHFWDFYVADEDLGGWSRDAK